MKLFLGETEIKEGDFVYPTLPQEFVPTIESEQDPHAKLAVFYYDQTHHYLLWLYYNGTELVQYLPPFTGLISPVGEVTTLVVAVIPLASAPVIEDRTSFVPTESKGEQKLSFRTVPTPRDIYVKSVQIGKGVYGTVYLTKSLMDHRIYATKYIAAPKSSKDLEGQHRIANGLREIHMLSLVPPHKNIIALIDSGQDLLGTFLVMPYLKHSKELEDFLDDNREKLGLRQKVNLMLEMTDAVRHLHRYRIVHLDLKEANYLVDTLTLTPTLIDFNLSCLSLSSGMPEDTSREEKYNCEGSRGTPLYMDTNLLFARKGEKLSASGYLKADVYSLGVIFYQLITGHHPFYQAKDEDSFSDFKKVMRQYQLLPFTSTNASLDMLIKYILSKSRPDIEEVYEALTLILQEI